MYNSRNLIIASLMLSLLPLGTHAAEITDDGAGDISDVATGTSHAVSSARRAVRLRADSERVAIIEQGRTITPATHRPPRKVYNVTDIRRSRVLILNTGQAGKGGGG